MSRTMTANHAYPAWEIYRVNLILVVFVAILLVSMCDSPILAQDMQRGIKNYQDIMAGRKKLEQLSPQERQEVLIIFRRLQSLRGESGASSDCRDARRRAEDAAAELANYTRRLQNCAQAQDYSDDCSTEFRRVRNAHSEYESAISDVSSYCN
jgi:Sec-independent protein translocase protein TatA